MLRRNRFSVPQSYTNSLSVPQNISAMRTASRKKDNESDLLFIMYGMFLYIMLRHLMRS